MIVTRDTLVSHWVIFPLFQINSPKSLFQKLPHPSFLYFLNESGELLDEVLSGAHNPERATPILGLCHGVFTDRFIFRRILGKFFPRKWNLRHVYKRIRSIRYQNVIKRQKLSFLGL